MLTLPPKNCLEREAAILQAVKDCEHNPTLWSLIRAYTPEHSAVFFVMSDALKFDLETEVNSEPVGAFDVRVNVCAETQQAIADALDCSLLTAKLADLIFAQANVRVSPCTMSGQGADLSHMADTSWMVEHSRRIESKLPLWQVPDDLTVSSVIALPTAPEKFALGPKCPVAFAELISTVGKHWVIDDGLLKKPGFACNYGWHFATEKFGGYAYEANVTHTGRLIQGRGFAHNSRHSDYSQTCQLVSNWCLVDGELIKFQDLLGDSVFASLASHSGPMTYLKQGSS